MKLLLDIGNTKITVYLQQENGEYKKLLTDTTKDQPVGNEILKLVKDYNVSTCLISSVVPEVNEELIKTLSTNGIETKLFVYEDYQKFVDFGELEYRSMGADRVVVDAAAIQKYGSDVIVFDLGTAITVDVIKDSAYKTGYIFPGIRLIRDTLISGASQLNTFEFNSLSKTDEALDTITQLNDGILYGVLGCINQYIKVALRHYDDENVKIVLTGGSLYNIKKIIPTEQLVEILEANVIIDMDLMLEGLVHISEKLGVR